MVTGSDKDDGGFFRPVRQEELVELCAVFAPRRFAACEVSADGSDGWVVGLGLCTAEGGVMMSPAGGSLWSLSSPERVVRLLGRRRDVRLVWLDPHPDEGGPEVTSPEQGPECASA